MSGIGTVLARVALRLGGTRVLALPMLRILALIAGYVWIALAPASFAGWDTADTLMLAFLLYTLLVFAALWTRPAAMLRLNFLVLLVDLAFALALVRVTGGAESTMFLALLLIAGLQSYYYGIRRGTLVAAASGAAYLAVVWPTLDQYDPANMAIRMAVLVGTAVGVGVLAEVEERERLQVTTLSAEARARERFISRLVEGLREGVFALDREGRIVAWNRAMEDRYALPREAAAGRSYLDLVDPAGRSALAEPLRSLLRGEREGFDLPGLEQRSVAGRRMIVNVKASLLREGALLAGAVVLVEEVTERVALERSARQAEKLAALGTLAAGLAHELNNPIGVISTRAELLLLDTEDQPATEGVREDLRVIHRHAQRVARITQGLLSFARHPRGEQGPVDLNRLVDETLLLVEKSIVKDGISLKRVLAPALSPVWGDANALQQVLMNLLTNARDALGDHGEIAVETSPFGDPPTAVRLVVRDTGSGIPAEVLPRIFDPFFTTKAEGTGLGLAISYGIIRDHQGTVDVQSRPGEGTSFVLVFPAVER